MPIRLLSATIMILVVLALDSRALAMPYTVRYRGKKALAEKTTTDQHGATFPIGELSGITYLGGDNFIAVANGTNKLVALKITFEDDGKIKSAKVIAGRSIATARDYEGVAYTDPTRHSVFLAEEATPGPPFVYEFRLDSGAQLQKIDLPPVFVTQRDNYGLESMTRRADGQEMWTANEEALTADGARSTPRQGSIVRLVHFTVHGNKVVADRQYAYLTDSIHVGRGAEPSRSGVSDLVVLDDGTLLVLERSCGIGLPPFRTSIYQVDFEGATDISQPPFYRGLSRLEIGKQYKPVGKKELFASGAIVENVEGLCLGPTLAGGNRVLLGIVDDGGGTDPLSRNTLVAFEITDEATALTQVGPAVGAAGALVVVGALVMGARKRRKRAATV